MEQDNLHSPVAITYAQALLEKEELYRDEIYKILGGKRPSRHTAELTRDGILTPGANDRPTPIGDNHESPQE